MHTGSASLCASACLPELYKKFGEEVKEKAVAVKEAGGLYILGTERHESRRIDNQLRGRSGRQGDEGESRNFVQNKYLAGSIRSR